MKKYVKRIIALVLVAALALGGLWYANRVLIMKRTDGILTMQNFYAQPERTVDVLFVGNSHSGINIDTATLYDDYGIASYNLWGGVQPLWNSYHYIVEALKYQRPKLIVLEVMASTSDYEYSEEQTAIKNTAGMRLSMNKLEAVKASAPADRQLNLLLGFPLYHGRFNELTEEDFQHFPWSDGLENFKGSTLRYGVGHYEKEYAEGIEECAPIMEKELEYLEKIIELARKEDIQLLLLKTPSLDRTATQPCLNTVAELAEENGLAFINMNLMDAELSITDTDWSLDRHLNATGSRKVSHWIGEYLTESFSIPDRRGDSAYQSWEMNSHRVNNEYLNMIADTDEYIAELSQNGRALLVIKNSPWEQSEDYQALIAKLEALGVHADMLADSGNNAELIIDTSSPSSAEAAVSGESMVFTLDGQELTVNFEYQDVVHGNKKLTWFGGNDLTLIVYDEVTHELVDILAFSTLNGCEFMRVTDEE